MTETDSFNLTCFDDDFERHTEEINSYYECKLRSSCLEKKLKHWFFRFGNARLYRIELEVPWQTNAEEGRGNNKDRDTHERTEHQPGIRFPRWAPRTNHNTEQVWNAEATKHPLRYQEEDYNLQPDHGQDEKQKPFDSEITLSENMNMRLFSLRRTRSRDVAQAL